MRQAGFLAAAGLYALVHNVARLVEDHERAKQLGAVLSVLPWVDKVRGVRGPSSRGRGTLGTALGGQGERAKQLGAGHSRYCPGWAR